jgi:hypothetical protein
MRVGILISVLLFSAFLQAQRPQAGPSGEQPCVLLLVGNCGHLYSKDGVLINWWGASVAVKASKEDYLGRECSSIKIITAVDIVHAMIPN